MTLRHRISLILDRYRGVVERTPALPMMSFHASLYCNVLREAGHHLTSQEIADFPAACKAWLARHPEFPQAPGSTALMILDNSSHAELTALVHKLERQL